MGAGASTKGSNDVPESAMDQLDVAAFNILRVEYEKKKAVLGDQELLDHLKSQFHIATQLAGVSGGAVEPLPGMAMKRSSARQSTLNAGGSFARKSKLSIIKNEVEGTPTRMSFNMPDTDANHARKIPRSSHRLSNSDEPFLTPNNVEEKKDKIEKFHVRFSQVEVDEVTFKVTDEGNDTGGKIRARQPTTFVKAAPPKVDHVSFGEDEKDGECKESEEDKSERAAKLRSRQPTTFVKGSPKQQHVQFDETKSDGALTDRVAEDLEGKESEEDRAERNAKLRSRQPTTFVKGGKPTVADDEDHVTFAESKDDSPAAEETKEGEESEADKAERKAKLRSRQPTAFVGKPTISADDEDAA